MVVKEIIKKELIAKSKSIKPKLKTRFKLLIVLLILLVLISTIFVIYSYNQHQISETKGMATNLFPGNDIASTKTILSLFPIILGLLFLTIVITILLIINHNNTKDIENVNNIDNIDYKNIISDNRKKISKEAPVVSPNDFNLTGKKF